MREKLTEACRGKGSTLFLSLKRLRHACYAVYAIAVCFGMFVLCILVMRKCLQYLRCLHMIMRIYV